VNSKTLGGALGLLTALFIGFAWWVYVAAAGKLHWAVPVLVTVTPLLLGASVWWWQRVSARRHASSLERALAADGARAQQRASGARRPELERLRSEFEQAVAALKGSKLAAGGSGRDALYRLPWYAIIGPPACGKTTVLRNSGLKFPYVPGTGDRLKGVGGTRNCDWWLSNHGILLDTAGRWTLEEEDQDEWLTFLDLLKRNRSDRPLNGVIAAISVAGDDETSIAGVDLAGVKRLAARMRERLDEITGRLGVALPVYVLFTKCDLIPGFVETFSELAPQERRQIWGFTTPLLSGESRAPGALFSEQFEILRDSLEQVVLARMSDETNVAAIAPIYEFPAQFSALKSKLEIFMDELFEQSLYGETPALRGAYFTSGTQEGAPADLLFDQLSNALQLRPQATETRSEKKSYFLHDVLMNVVFEDRSLATASQSAVLRLRRRRRQITMGLFAIAALVASLPTVSCQQNLNSLAHTQGLVARVHAGEAPAPRATKPAHTDLLSALGEDVQRHVDGPSSPLARFGLYQGEALKQPLEQLYALALKEWTVRPLLTQSNARLITMTQQLEGLRQRSATRAVLDDRSRSELRKALELHLLLTTPREACAPTPLARKEWLTGRLAELWQKADPALDSQTTLLRKATLDSYLDLTDGREELLFDRNARSVAIARPALMSDNKVEGSLRSLLEQHAEEQRTLAQLTGASMVYQSSALLHGAFTREAWLQAASDISSPDKFRTGGERWLLGCDPAASDELRSARQSQAFQQEYVKQFQEGWSRFLSYIVARSPGNAAEAETMLVELVSRPGVLGKLFQAVKENTDLPPPPPSTEDVLVDIAASAVKKAAASKGKEGVLPTAHTEAPPPELQKLKRTFSELAAFGVSATPEQEPPLEQYRRQLESVLMALKAYRADESKIGELAVATRAAQDSVDMLLRNNTGSWGVMLRELLLPPLAGIANIALQDRGRQLERQWCELVYRPFQEQLAGRYPLQTDSKQPASLQSFQRFFQPGTGSLWAFVDSQLRGYVTQAGGHFRFEGAHASDARTLLRDDLLQFLSRAYQLRRAFFPGDSPSVRMPFRIRVRGAPGYSVTSFRAGATNVRYDSSGEVWIPAEWPGDQPSLGATLSVTPYDGVGPRPLTKEGEWGLFSLLDEREGARVLERSSRQLTVGWKPKGDLHWIKVDFATDDPYSPLLSIPLGGASPNLLPLSVPARIANAGDGC
jgi:type VI secretion system protein ImpL